MISPWPFVIWVIDIIGELLAGKGNVKYVVVVVDYFTKWVEVEPLAAITSRRCRASFGDSLFVGVGSSKS